MSSTSEIQYIARVVQEGNTHYWCQKNCFIKNFRRKFEIEDALIGTFVLLIEISSCIGTPFVQVCKKVQSFKNFFSL
jgi:hypothetical protein